MASTSDSLPSSPSLPTNAAIDAGADQEFTSDHHNLFLPSSSTPANNSLYRDSSFHGLLNTSSSQSSPPLPPAPPRPTHLTKPAKKRPRASRRPPTTVLTTDTSNFRAMVQEFTGFPAPPFAAAPPPAVRPRLLGGPPFLMHPSPLKYQQINSSMLLPPSSCTTTTTLANTAIDTGASSNNSITASTSSLVGALALFAKSNVMPTSAGGSGAADHHYHGIGMGGFNPFDDLEAPAAAEAGERINGGGHGFFSSFVTGDKYGGVWHH